MEIAWNFGGKAAIVTGGGRGIGLAVSTALAQAGARVYLFERDRVDGQDIWAGQFEVDVSDSAAVNAAVAELPETPTLVVNNAGITRDRSIAKMSDDEWRTVLDVNLTGAFHVLRAAVPGMVRAGGGRIVNIASINGLRGKFGQANYAAAKAGLIGLTKTAAREFGGKGITVNAIAPGMVLTDMTLSLPKQFRDQALNESALNDLPTPDDIANTVMFLLSDAARMITGEVVRVDAGQYI